MISYTAAVFFRTSECHQYDCVYIIILSFHVLIPILVLVLVLFLHLGLLLIFALVLLPVFLLALAAARIISIEYR